MFTPEAEFVFDDPTAFHARNHMLNPYAEAGNRAVGCLFVRGQLPAAWLFLGLLHGNARHSKALKAEILIQHAVGWEHIVLLVGHRFIVPGAFIGRAEKVNAAIVGNQQQIFERMLFFLATVVEPLLIGVEWAVDRAFRAIMQKKMGRPVQHDHPQAE